MPQRYFVLENNGSIEGQDAHHIRHVMRMTLGDSIIVCHQGKCFDAVISGIGTQVHYTIKRELLAPTSNHVTLVQGLPKHPKPEFVAKYATIFGVSHLVFVPMNRSIARLENTANKQKRLDAIMKEAAELSHRFDVPSIQFLESIKSLDMNPFQVILLADEAQKDNRLESFYNPSLHQRIMIIIGPEGGIDPEERKWFIEQGAHPITLGHAILPTEAASLYLLSRLLA